MSWLKQVLQSGHFAVTAEVGPPKGSDPQVIRKNAICSKVLLMQSISPIIRRLSSACQVLLVV